MNLSNNSKEMKTIVETFVIEETADLIYDNEKLDKWNDLVRELNLQGQTTIVKPEKSPIPFMHLKKSLVNVFECLCPRRVNAEKYNITPIPLEILELIALSKREGYFEKVEIWYDEKSPDPICVGMKYNSFYSRDRKGSFDTSFPTKEEAISHQEANGVLDKEPYPMDETYYLLGKWADVKHSFDELKEMATKRFIAEKGNSYRKEIKEAQRGLDDLETEAFDRFN
jgi:hypothetical protein